jgi:D-alanine-D-alanine ligase
VPITDKKIGVLMGGTSAEREVSLKSGTAVFNALKGLRYNAVAIDAGADICEVLKREGVEIAFIILHGGYGEDGSLQGLLEVLGIPYTGSGVLASALAMDKEASKKIFLYHKIPVAPFVTVQASRPGPHSGRLGRLAEESGFAGENEPSEAAKFEVRRSKKYFTLKTPAPAGRMRRQNARLRIAFEMPWVVKPAAEGSSVGVSIVKDESFIDAAMEIALGFGERVIIEKFIRGKEIQVGILNDRILGSVEVRPKLEFYSYEAKYTPGMTEYVLPPEVHPEVLQKAERIALSAHLALGCTGATRVDLVVDDEGNACVLEVNTIPGMTETSLLPKIARLSGLDFSALLEEILKEALAGREGK